MNSKYLLILIKTFCIIDTSISTKRVLKILTCGYWIYLLCRHNDWEPNNLQYREKKSFDNVLKMNGLKLGHKFPLENITETWWLLLHLLLWVVPHSTTNSCYWWKVHLSISPGQIQTSLWSAGTLCLLQILQTASDHPRWVPQCL